MGQGHSPLNCIDAISSPASILQGHLRGFMTSESILLVSKAVGQLAIPSSQGCTVTPKEPHAAFAEPAFGVTTTHDTSPGKAPNIS